RRYLHNLNTHPAYRPLRERREALRRQGRPLETPALVDGLLDYSERREAYIEEIRALLEFNRELIEDATGSS
ncbi:MAG: Bax protein, partial [Gammaproteobacteria bacterium]|nr:Bax protein [Gammaproteobacteria bacterium]